MQFLNKPFGRVAIVIETHWLEDVKPALAHVMPYDIEVCVTHGMPHVQISGNCRGWRVNGKNFLSAFSVKAEDLVFYPVLLPFCFYGLKIWFWGECHELLTPNSF